MEVIINELPDVDVFTQDEIIISGEELVLTTVTNADTIIVESLPEGTLYYEGENQVVYLIPDSNSYYLFGPGIW